MRSSSVSHPITKPPIKKAPRAVPKATAAAVSETTSAALSRVLYAIPVKINEMMTCRPKVTPSPTRIHLRRSFILSPSHVRLETHGIHEDDRHNRLPPTRLGLLPSCAQETEMRPKCCLN